MLRNLLTKGDTVKSKGKILQNFVAFSEYMNFKKKTATYVIRKLGVVRFDEISKLEILFLSSCLGFVL